MSARYTTGAVARTLHLTYEGVRYLVRADQLPCDTTSAGWRIFREDDVLRLAAKRDQMRLRGVHLLRPRKLGGRDGPRQLSLFGLQKVK